MKQVPEYPQLVVINKTEFKLINVLDDQFTFHVALKGVSPTSHTLEMLLDGQGWSKKRLISALKVRRSISFSQKSIVGYICLKPDWILIPSKIFPFL